MSTNKEKSNRYNKITEQQNTKTIDIDEKTIREILTIINDEDAGVALAVEKKNIRYWKFY